MAEVAEEIWALKTDVLPPPFRVLLNPWQYKLWCDLGFPPESAMIDPPLGEL